MEDVLTQLTGQFLQQMTAAEKSRALRSLKALIDAELFDLAASEGAEDDPDRACPWCGSPHYVKRGRDGRGRPPIRSTSTGSSRRNGTRVRGGPYTAWRDVQCGLAQRICGKR